MQNLIFPVKRSDHFMYTEAMFRTRTRPGHGGLDFTPCVWNRPEPFYAPEPGTLIIVDRTLTKDDQSGLDVMLLGDWTGIRWWGGHLSKISLGLRTGLHVRQGTVLGMTGSTGNSSATHLHLEAHFPRINEEINPWPWLWDAPDVDGSIMPLAATREQALLDYPLFNSKPAPIWPEEEDDIMGVSFDDMKKAIKDIVDERVGQSESRMRREVRPSIRFVNQTADGKTWTVNDSPYAAVVHNAGGFVMPMEGPEKRAGQIASLRGNGYKHIDEQDEPRGLHEDQFFNEIKDILIATGRAPQADRKTAQALWSPVASA